MFKKSLLALALSATAFGATASVISVGDTSDGSLNFSAFKSGTTNIPAVVSSEGLALAKNTIKFATGAANVDGQNVALNIAIGTDYPASSVLVVEVSGADFDTSASGVASPTMVKGDAGHVDLTLLDASNANKLVFNVGGTATSGDDYLLNAALKNVTGDVTFTVYANAPVIQGFDKSQFKALTLKAQHSVSTTNTTTAKIDVGNDRKSFTTDATVAATDKNEDFDVTLARGTADVHSVEGYDDATTKAAQVLTLNGDFSALDTDTDLSLADETVILNGVGGTLALAKDGTITVSEQNNSTLDKIGVDAVVKATNANVLETTTFTGKVVSKYQLASDTSLKSSYSADVAFGSWTLNGSVVEVPYMPFGDNTAVIMRLTNSSSKTGDISVRYMAEGSVTAWKSVGKVGEIGPGVTDISSLVMDAIKADLGAEVTSGKVAIELTTNVPGGNVDVTALFKVISEQDRGVMKTVRKDN